MRKQNACETANIVMTLFHVHRETRIALNKKGSGWKEKLSIYKRSREQQAPKKSEEKNKWHKLPQQVRAKAFRLPVMSRPPCKQTLCTTGGQNTSHHLAIATHVLTLRVVFQEVRSGQFGACSPALPTRNLARNRWHQRSRGRRCLSLHTSINTARITLNNTAFLGAASAAPDFQLTGVHGPVRLDAMEL